MLIKNKITSTLLLAAIIGMAGCSSEHLKIVAVPDPLTNTHTTLVDKARASLAVGGANVYNDNSQQFTIVMPDRLTFNKDGSEISDWQKPYLDKLINVLNDPNVKTIDISSHYDNVAGVVLPLKYSQQYAYAFSQYINSHGLQNPNTTITSYGTTQPISHNETHYGNEANQRIELVVKLVAPENVQLETDYKKQFDKNGNKIEKKEVIKKKDIGKEIPKYHVEPPKNPL